MPNSRRYNNKNRSYEDFKRYLEERAEKDYQVFDAVPGKTGITAADTADKATVSKVGRIFGDNDKLISVEDKSKLYGPVQVDDYKPEAKTLGDTVAENSEVPEYQKYYDKEKELYEKYLNRADFEYDVDADEIYRIYRDQTIKDAEKARRDTVAQAAGLTGGYGSTYAQAAGAAAYNDRIDDLDAMIPEFYNAAMERYNAEGEKLLEDAQISKAYGDKLYQESPEYQALFASALANASGSEGSSYEALQRLKTGDGVYDYEGDNNTGAKIYDEAMRIYAGIATGSNGAVPEKYLGEHKDYTEAQIREDLMTWQYKDGKYLTEEEVDLLVNDIMSAREVEYLGALEDSEGQSLIDYAESLTKEGYSFDELYDKLSKWEGGKLDEADILIIINAIAG